MDLHDTRSLIFQFLDAFSKSKASKVCKTWRHHLTTDRSCWTPKDFCDLPRINPRNARHVLYEWPTLPIVRNQSLRFDLREAHPSDKDITLLVLECHVQRAKLYTSGPWLASFTFLHPNHRMAQHHLKRISRKYPKYVNAMRERAIKKQRIS